VHARVHGRQILRVTAPRRTPALLGGKPAFAEPVYVTRARVPDRALFDSLVASVLEARWFTNDGDLVRRLEEHLQHRLGAAFCALFSSGTTALQAALRSLRLSGEVITTPFTFPATVHAIEWNGLTPVFCDIDPETYNLDPDRAANLVSERTAALVPVHVFGNPCAVERIEKLARRQRLAVVYDAAHAFGVSCRGRAVGCWGDLSVFSFHATKLFHTAEGGAVVGADMGRRRELALLRNFGIVDEETVHGVGVNGKLSELHAALGLALLGGVDDDIRKRAALDARYRRRLADIPGIRFQRLEDATAPNHAYFTIEVGAAGFGLSRDELHRALRAENIITRKYFYPLCSENSSYRHLPTASPDRLPNAHRIATRILCLPLYGDLGTDAVDRIVDAILTIHTAARAIRRAVAGPPSSACRLAPHGASGDPLAARARPRQR
jgi:dTDP-4-amino-4,6-dideoxygalactose transaminase